MVCTMKSCDSHSKPDHGDPAVLASGVRGTQDLHNLSQRIRIIGHGEDSTSDVRQIIIETDNSPFSKSHFAGNGSEIPTDGRFFLISLKFAEGWSFLRASSGQLSFLLTEVGCNNVAVCLLFFVMVSTRGFCPGYQCAASSSSSSKISLIAVGSNLLGRFRGSLIYVEKKARVVKFAVSYTLRQMLLLFRMAFP